jgi:Ca2+-binding EF-hand superfamily protein
MRDANVTDWSPDLNSDGKINTGDLMVILRNRGQRLN